MNCEQCRINPKKKDCLSCKNLISGRYLAEEPEKKIKLRLESVANGNEYNKKLELISPIGLVLRGRVPPGDYKIELAKNLKLIVTTVMEKGKSPYQVFDIKLVLRNGEEKYKLSQQDFELLKMSPRRIIDEVTEELSLESKEIIKSRLEKEIAKSELLDAFAIGEVLKYKQGQLESLSTKQGIDLAQDYLQQFIEGALVDDEYKRKTVVGDSGTQVYDLHAVPIEANEGGIIAVDVTDVINKEKEEQKKEIQIYKNVIQAVTGGKLNLLTAKEIKEELLKGNLILKESIESEADLAPLRDKSREVLADFNLKSQTVVHVILAISEAITNVLKHAQQGEFLVETIAEEKLRWVIADQGPGIDFDNLPKATLMKNYSDTATFSLGSGFTIMLRFIDRLLLKTDEEGTTLILEVDLEEVS